MIVAESYMGKIYQIPLDIPELHAFHLEYAQKSQDLWPLITIQSKERFIGQIWA